MRKKKHILSVCWVNCPYCIYSRTYRMRELSRYVDYFVVMMFDMQPSSDSYRGYCKATSQDALGDVEKYSSRWKMHSHATSRQVVIIFPWYGYLHECKNYFAKGHLCYTYCDKLNSGSSQVRTSF